MSFESVDQDQVWFSLLPKKSFSLWLESQEMQVLALTEGYILHTDQVAKEREFLQPHSKQNLY